eukprot:11220770-Lingulodinium_polyedra.AAC.1
MTLSSSVTQGPHVATRGADGARTRGVSPQRGNRSAAVAPLARNARPRATWHHLRGGWQARP